MMYCLGCFFCAQVYGFTVRICSLAIAGQHLSINRQVHGLCLGLTGRLREKPDIPLSFFPHSLPSPSLSPIPSLSIPFPSSPLPPLRSRPLKSTQGVWVLLFMLVCQLSFQCFLLQVLNKLLTLGHPDRPAGGQSGFELRIPGRAKKFGKLITTVLKCVVVVLHLHTLFLQLFPVIRDQQIYTETGAIKINK